MLTRDFSGEYDYERSEANYVAESFEDYIACEYTADEYKGRVEKELAHWSKILTPEGLADFKDQFNKRTKNLCMTAYGQEFLM
jgi:hypothetical protein